MKLKRICKIMTAAMAVCSALSTASAEEAAAVQDPAGHDKSSPQVQNAPQTRGERIAQMANSLGDRDFIRPNGKPSYVGNELLSPLGYQVVPLDPKTGPEEGGWDSLIMDGDRLLARIEYALPIMFSPRGDILLMRDAMADDVLSMFMVDVLGIANGNRDKERHYFGGRLFTMQNPCWSKDGRFLRFDAYLPEPPPEPEYSFCLVSDLMGWTDAKKQEPAESAEFHRNFAESQCRLIRQQLDDIDRHIKQAESKRRSKTERVTMDVYFELLRFINTNTRYKVELMRSLAMFERRLDITANTAALQSP